MNELTESLSRWTGPRSAHNLSTYSQHSHDVGTAVCRCGAHVSVQKNADGTWHVPGQSYQPETFLGACQAMIRWHKKNR